MNKQEIEKDIEILKYYEAQDYFFSKDIPALQSFRRAIKSYEQQLNNGWMPVSEYLPEETGEYLCTVEWYGTSTKKLLINNGYEIGKRIMLVHYLDSNKSFKECEGFCTYKVIAWKLQELYN